MRVSSIRLAVGGFAALLLATVLPGPVAAVSVSTPPASWTPSIATGGADGTVEQIRQIVPCGSMMYAVGTFTSIRQNGVTYARNNAFSFNAATGAVSAWDPNVNGKVNSVALSSDCSTAYLGGVFRMVGGNSATNIAAVSTSTSAFIPGFAHTAAGQVNALLMSGSHLLVGGFFTAINGSSRSYLVSLNPSNGTDDGYVNLNISGTYVFTDDDGASASPNATRVYNFALSPDKTKLLAMGVFTSVGGQGRREIFMLDLGLLGATLNPWYSSEFDQNCDVQQPYWLQDAAWAPDGSKIYIATTGFRPATGPAHSVTAPRAGLCDAAAAFTASGPATRLWINYTGCDSLFSVAADATSVYVAGHNRWMSNAGGCGFRSVGSVDTLGMAVLSPFNGAVTYNPTRSRGIGADDMLVTSAGLWIASDNLGASTQCAGVTGFSGLCFLPNAKGTALTDYNADGRADNAVWRPSNGTWYVLGSAPVVLGQSGDVPQVGNFTGDAKPDPAVWRPSTGQWFVNGVGGSTQWGASTDKPVAGDYDVDPATDFAVWRPSNGTWYVHPVGTGTQFGVSSDIPVPGDYNGDAKTDIAVWRPSNGTWYLKINGVNRPPVAFGQNGDKPIVADFTGDGKADIAVWRPSNGTWYVKGGVPANQQWGLSTDIPVAGDFTGDGKADFAVWRPTNGYWFVAAPAPAKTQWGKAGDVPLHAFP